MTALILSLRHSLLDKISDKIKSMDMEKTFYNLMMAALIGIGGVAVSFIGDMSRNLQSLTVSVKELNERMSQVSDTMKDHELRLRDVENKQRR